MAEALHQLMGRLAARAFKAQVEQRAVLVGPAATQHGVEAATVLAAAQVDARAGQGLLADAHVGHDVVAFQYALDQQLQPAAAGLLAEDARLDHARVVEHQQVAGLQQIGQLVEDAVGGRVGIVAAVEQARGTALGGRMLGNQLLGKLEVEIAEREHTGQGGHAVLEGRTWPVPSSLNGSWQLSQTLGSSPELPAITWPWRPGAGARTPATAIPDRGSPSPQGLRAR